MARDSKGDHTKKTLSLYSMLFFSNIGFKIKLMNAKIESGPAQKGQRGGVEGSKKSLLRFVPARRAGSDAIVRIVLARTVKEKFEVNLCSKNVVNLQ